LDWNNMWLVDASLYNALDWGFKTLRDDNNILSQNWTSRSMWDHNVAQAIDYDSRLLMRASGPTTVDWNLMLLGDQFNGLSANWSLRNLVASDGTTTVLDWSNPNNLVTSGSMTASAFFGDGSGLTNIPPTPMGNLTGAVTSVGLATTIVGPVPADGVDLSTVTVALGNKLDKTGTSPLVITGAAGTITTESSVTVSGVFAQSVTASVFTSSAVSSSVSLLGPNGTLTPGTVFITGGAATVSGNGGAVTITGGQSTAGSTTAGAVTLQGATGPTISRGGIANVLGGNSGGAFAGNAKLLGGNNTSTGLGGTAEIGGGNSTSGTKGSISFKIGGVEKGIFHANGWLGVGVSTPVSSIQSSGTITASTFNAVGSAYQLNGVNFYDSTGFTGNGAGITGVTAVSVPPSGVDLSTVTADIGTRVLKTGDTMTGPLLVNVITSTGTGADLLVSATDSSASGVQPSSVTIRAGDFTGPNNASGGDLTLRAGNASGTQIPYHAGNLFINAGNHSGTMPNGNITISAGGQGSGPAGAIFINVGRGNGAAGSSITFRTNGAAGAARMSIDTAGTVHIGTDTNGGSGLRLYRNTGVIIAQSSVVASGFFGNSFTSTGPIVGLSSVNASGFFGSGEGLYNVARSSATDIVQFTFTQTAFAVAYATVTLTTRGYPVIIRLNATGQTTNNANFDAGLLIDGALSSQIGDKAIFSTRPPANNVNFAVNAGVTIYGLSAGSHTFALTMRTVSGTGTVFNDATRYGQWSATEIP